jgi:hypothetical protein
MKFPMVKNNNCKGRFYQIYRSSAGFNAAHRIILTCILERKNP